MEYGADQSDVAAIPVECRPTGNGYGLAVMMGLVTGIVIFAGVYRPQPDAGEQIAFWLFVAFLCSITLGAALWDFRSRIVADKAGLRWRSTGRWRSASWAEVEDYYFLSLTGSSASRAICVVRTRGGTVRVAPTTWTHAEELRRVIHANAVNGPEEGWRLLGGRHRDGDVAVFPYGTRASGLTAAFYAGCGVALPVLWLPMMGKLHADWRVTGPEAVTLAAISLAVNVLLLGMVLPFVWLCFLATRQWWRHRRQVLEVTPTGLALSDGNRRQFIPWDEVVEYGYQRERRFGVARYVRGASGETIQFLPSLSRFQLVEAMIQRLAIRAEHPGWKPLPEEVLGGPRLRWRGGARVYHYRSRLTRAMLWFGGAFAVTTWTAHVTTAVGLRPYAAGSLAFADALALILDAAFVCALLCYYRCAVLVDSHGITWEWPFGRKRLSWLEVSRYGTRGNKDDGTRFVAGEHATLWLYPLIVDLEELEREISTRAPQAEGSWPASAESLPVTTP